MGTQKLVFNIKDNDWVSVRQAIAKLASKLGPVSEPTFAGLTLDDLTASRLIATNASKVLESSDLVSWVTGTANEINVADDGDGTITIGIVDPLIVGKGGTGIAALTDHGILLGSGTGAITPLAAATNGQLPIGSTDADPVLATLTGTANQVNVANAAGSITLSTPQDIHTGANIEFSTVSATAFGAGTLLLYSETIQDSSGSLIIGVSDNPNLLTLSPTTLTVDGIIDASAGEILVEDNDTSEPSGKSDGYIGVAVIGGQPRMYFVVNGELNYVEGSAAVIPETGNPLGLLLVLTYS